MTTLIACPGCGCPELDIYKGRLDCRGCGKWYAIDEDGALVFATPEPGSGQIPEDAGSHEAIKRWLHG